MDPDTLYIEIEEQFRDGALTVEGVMALVDMIVWLAAGGFPPKHLKTKNGRDAFESYMADMIGEE